MQVVNGALTKRHGSSAPTPLMEAYAHFRLDRQAIPCSNATMLTYEYTLGAFLRWVAREHPSSIKPESTPSSLGVCCN